MLFHTFNSQEERRAFGGSMFIELQFCKLPVGTKDKKIISVDSMPCESETNQPKAYYLKRF